MKSFKDFYLFVEENLSRLAMDYAVKAHSGQTRSDGTSYVLHPYRVAKNVRKFKQSDSLDALVSAAYLHDTLEDTDTTLEDLKKMFGGLVASLVQELTSDDNKIKEMGKTKYLSQKMSSMSDWGLVIKLADRLDNVQDIATARTPEWRQKYKKQTLGILNTVERNRRLTTAQKKLVSAIRDKLNEV